MVNTVHVTVAVAIVHLIPSPVAIPIAFVSHFALDTVPHWNWHPGGSHMRISASLADFFIATVICVYAISHTSHPLLIALASFASVLPDLVQGPYYFWSFRPYWLCQFIGWESRRQKWPWMKPWLGICTQVVTLLIALILWKR